MLILTRKINETIVIGNDEVSITVLGVKGNQIKLGVNAPKSIPVHRKEIFLKIREEERLLEEDLPGDLSPDKGFISELVAHLRPLKAPAQITH